MNNKFDWKRFGTMVRHDVRRCSPRFSAFGNSMIGILFFTPAMMLLQNLTGQVYGTTYRLAMIVLMSLMLATQAPSLLYSNIGRKRKRGDVYYAMLPASKQEKYLSMALLTIVLVPLTLLVANIVLDTLLTAIHTPFYHGYLWQCDMGKLNPTLPMLCCCVLAFVGSSLGFIYANAVRNKGWHTRLYVVLALWLMGGLMVPMFLDTERQWMIFIAEVPLTALTGFLGWNKIKNMGY